MGADELDPTLVAEMVAARMEAFGPTWTAVGNEAIGPTTLAVRALTRHDAGPNHIDLGFVLDRAGVFLQRNHGDGSRPTSASRVSTDSLL